MDSWSKYSTDRASNQRFRLFSSCRTLRQSTIHTFQPGWNSAYHYVGNSMFNDWTFPYSLCRQRKDFVVIESTGETSIQRRETTICWTIYSICSSSNSYVIVALSSTREIQLMLDRENAMIRFVIESSTILSLSLFLLARRTRIDRKVCEFEWNSARPGVNS